MSNGTLEGKKLLALVIDPGYDSNKIVVNGQVSLVLRDIKDVSEVQEAFLGEKPDDFLASIYKSNAGHRYYIGQYARTKACEHIDKNGAGQYKSELMRDEEVTIAYLMTENCKISILSALAAAIIQYKNEVDNDLDLEKIDEENKVVICLGLPHKYLNQYKARIEEIFVGTHELEIELKDTKHTVKFTISDKAMIEESQAFAAFVGAATDDSVNFLEGKNGFIDDTNKPVLVVDGGYRTMGVFRLGRTNTIDHDTSYLEYAAVAVYNNVARRIREEYKPNKPVTDIIVQDILKNSTDKLFKYKDLNGKMQAVKIDTIYEEERKKVFNEFWDELNKEFNDLTDIKTILCGGGTGAMFFDDFRDRINEVWGNVPYKPRLVLAEVEFMGKKYGPEYAIAIGLYKLLMLQIKLAMKSKK